MQFRTTKREFIVPFFNEVNFTINNNNNSNNNSNNNNNNNNNHHHHHHHSNINYNFKKSLACKYLCNHNQMCERTFY